MTKYEIMYILNSTLDEETRKATVESLNKILTDNGAKVLSSKELGQKELAYEIEDFKKGYYVKFLVEASNEAVEEYDRVCNIKEDIIRHILVKE
mgnify:CR=1 FL=1